MHRDKAPKAARVPSQDLQSLIFLEQTWFEEFYWKEDFSDKQGFLPRLAKLQFFGANLRDLNLKKSFVIHAAKYCSPQRLLIKAVNVLTF